MSTCFHVAQQTRHYMSPHARCERIYELTMGISLFPHCQTTHLPLLTVIKQSSHKPADITTLLEKSRSWNTTWQTNTHWNNWQYLAEDSETAQTGIKQYVAKSDYALKNWTSTIFAAKFWNKDWLSCLEPTWATYTMQTNKSGLASRLTCSHK
jgi:hypothetical protein